MRYNINVLERYIKSIDTLKYENYGGYLLWIWQIIVTKQVSIRKVVQWLNIKNKEQ